MEFLDFITQSFQDVLTFIHNGIYDFVTATFAQFVVWVTMAQIEFKIAMIAFSWDVAQQIIAQLNLSSYLDNAFAALDSTLFDFICFFRVPEAINLIMSALVTRYVMNFLGV
jgi:hypothetical protein